MPPPLLAAFDGELLLPLEAIDARTITANKRTGISRSSFRAPLRRGAEGTAGGGGVRAEKLDVAGYLGSWTG
jgi:hypothetical protein